MGMGISACRGDGQVNRLFLVVLVLTVISPALADHVRDLQRTASETKSAEWGRWGKDDAVYSSWTTHSNRLVPIYTFGGDLTKYSGANSCYRRPEKIESMYGYVPPGTVNSLALYLDQTDVYQLQRDALAAGKKYIILMIFDGMDWQTTQAAAIYHSGRVYPTGRGSGLSFQDYDRCRTDYGWFVSSPHNNGTDYDVNAQTVINPGGTKRGGYDANLGGFTPWAKPRNHDYLLGKYRRAPHVVTDSASSATSMTSGIKTFNAAINVDSRGQHVVPIARQLQVERGFSVGVVTSVPISHATPAAAYANNVTRNDYQDLTRDMIGLPSISHRRQPLPGVDVLIGGGWGEHKDEDEKQGDNFQPGNKFLLDDDLERINVDQGGAYVIAQRTAGANGNDVLMKGARRAVAEKKRFLGYFGASGGNLPYQTADGKYDPYGKEYTEADVNENPSLAQMTRAALGILSQNKRGFWLMVEAGDVDWANHDNNIDNSIGAVLSGADAFSMVTAWVEKYRAWNDTLVIVTADHGHYFRLLDPEVLIGGDAKIAIRKP